MSHSGPHPGWATQRQKRSQVMGPRRVLSFRPGGVGPQSREGVGVPRALTGRGATWLGWAPSPSCGKLLVACAASPWLPGSSSQPPPPLPPRLRWGCGKSPWSVPPRGSPHSPLLTASLTPLPSPGGWTGPTAFPARFSHGQASLFPTSCVSRASAGGPLPGPVLQAGAQLALLPHLTHLGSCPDREVEVWVPVTWDVHV